MRRVLIVERKGLAPKAKLQKTLDIDIMNFIDPIRRQIQQSDIVIFYCSLLNEYRFLKSRYFKPDNTVHKIDSPEDENELLTLIMGL